VVTDQPSPQYSRKCYCPNPPLFQRYIGVFSPVIPSFDSSASEISGRVLQDEPAASNISRLVFYAEIIHNLSSETISYYLFGTQRLRVYRRNGVYD
jgi:hypothetical protein